MDIRSLLIERIVAQRMKWRRKRMQDMLALMGLPAGSRIADFGGHEGIWYLTDHDFHVTLINLPGFNPPPRDPLRFRSIEGDACDLSRMFEDHSFDAVFSNSTIE